MPLMVDRDHFQLIRQTKFAIVKVNKRSKLIKPGNWFLLKSPSEELSFRITRIEYYSDLERCVCDRLADILTNSISEVLLSFSESQKICKWDEVYCFDVDIINKPLFIQAVSFHFRKKYCSAIRVK